MKIWLKYAILETNYPTIRKDKECSNFCLVCTSDPCPYQAGRGLELDSLSFIAVIKKQEA